MQIRKVGAGSGARWLNNSIHVIEKNARALLTAALLLAALAGVAPLFGPAALPMLLAIALLYPVLMGGLVAMAARVDAGENPRPFDLFAAFRSGRVLPLMVLALPQLLFGVVVVLMVVAALGVDNLGLIAQGEEPVMDAVNAGLFGWLFVVLVFGGLASFSATLFGIPLAMLDSQPGLSAIGLSLRAAFRNLGAVLLYLLCMVLAIVVAGFALVLVNLVLNLILGLLGPTAQQVGSQLLGIVFNALVFAVLACGHLLAWREVFGGHDGDARAVDENRPPEEVSAEF